MAAVFFSFFNLSIVGTKCSTWRALSSSLGTPFFVEPFFGGAKKGGEKARNYIDFHIDKKIIP